MSRPVLAPLVVALSALLVVPQIQAEPTAPLFVVEQQRAALVSRLAKQWSDAFATLPRERRLDHEQLSNALFALRADRLFAVTLAGDGEAVEAVLVDAKREMAKPRAAAKALGDATADLTYTPINPCRILDTRSTVAGPLTPNVARTFDGYSTNFATQGGTGSGCGIPSGVAALAMNVYAVNPTNLGFIKVWPANGTEPDVSTVNYQVGITAIATGTLVPVDTANSNRFTAKSPATVDFIADVVGFFKPPGDATSLDIKVAGQRVMRYEYNAISPNLVGGSPMNSATGGTFGATIGGGGTTGTSVPFDTGEISCGSTCANRVTDAYGTVSGGVANQAGVAGGTPISFQFATVGGGFGNIAAGNFSIVAGGAFNTASGHSAIVGGGAGNVASGSTATVGGGANNVASSTNGTVGGGYDNLASGSDTTISGGAGNIATHSYSTVSGGTNNKATGGFATIGGGISNTGGNDFTTVGGGAYNTASGPYATACGGIGNLSSGDAAIVGGGNVNTASGFAATVSGGTGNAAIGTNATVGGGADNIASGSYSFAIGRRAQTQSAGASPTLHHGAFVFADSNDFAFNSGAINEFSARVTGGVRFVTAIDGTGLPTWTCGVSGGAGGSWGCSSDRNLKTELIPLDGDVILERLAALPVYQWVAKDDPRRTPHAGPTAQDFMAAFGLGDNDRMIGFADAQGVAFAAIKGLNAKVSAKDIEIDSLRAEVAELKRAVEVLMARRSPDGMGSAAAMNRAD